MDVLQYITFKRLVTPVWQQELFLVLWCKRQSWVLWRKKNAFCPLLLGTNA